MIRFLILIIFLSITAFSQDSSHVEYDESFDPFSLHDEEKYFFESMSIDEIMQKLDKEELRKVLSRDTSAVLKSQGYRVQLYSTSDYRLADSLYYAAQERFNQKVYLIFDAPNYKIRVGDCANRDEAEELYKLAIKKGYQRAWIVRSSVQGISSLQKSAP